jgi:hypothetical protein
VGKGSKRFDLDTLFRTAALARVGLYLTRTEQEGARGCEDWDLRMRIAETFSIRVVSEFLVGYRATSHSMRVNAESMAASFAVVIDRARQRNPDLSPATFRSSTGDFYLYLAQTCDHWDLNSWSARYLKKALYADPRYLLRAWILKRCIRIQLKAITSSTCKMLSRGLSYRVRRRGKRPGLGLLCL